MKILIVTLLLAQVGIAAAQESWFNLSFPGGTPREFVDAVNKAKERSMKNPKPVNLLVPKELADIKIPPMELQAINEQALFETVRLFYRNSSEALDWVNTSPNLWVLMQRPDTRKSQVFYVGNLLQKFKIEDITTAVETTWKLGARDPVSGPPTLKYHQDTKLLIALASHSQLSTMSEVITQLRLAVEPAAEPAKKPADKKDP
jgi:hypothetical protein